MIAAACGTLAVLLAIAQLAVLAAASQQDLKQTFEPAARMAARSELFTALLAASAVVAGLLAARHRKWLLERHKAERLRLLKFGFLIDSAGLPGDSEQMAGQQKKVADEVRRIKLLREKDLDKWLEKQVLPDDDETEGPSGALTEVHKQLRDYLKLKRVIFQSRYF